MVLITNGNYELVVHLMQSCLECVVCKKFIFLDYSTIVHPDQTYCIPGRTIQNNLHLIRDIIWYSNKYKCPLGIVSVDQLKALDRVSHDYLFHTLQKLSFPQICPQDTLYQ